MGRLDQYAKQILAAETPVVTRGAAEWQAPSELNLTEVRLDGCLIVRDPGRLVTLPAPWSEAAEQDEIVFEAKMQGEHLDMRAYERACLRRQARQVQRMEDAKRPWDGDVPLWLVASHVPAVLSRRRRLREVGAGCYRVETGAFQLLWIAANELPLRDELIPFLIARSGRALDELGLWIRDRRPSDWLLRMIEFLPMSLAAHEELFRFVMTKTEDPEVKARQMLFLKLYVDMIPEVKAEVVAEMVAEAARKAAAEAAEAARKEAAEAAEAARKEAAEAAETARKEAAEAARKAAAEAARKEARSALRRVLSHRKLALSAEEEARIDACGDLEALERWHEQSLDASSAAEALR
jgi:hypothetical protein